MIDTVIVSGGNIQYGFALDFLKKIINRVGREKIFLAAADKGLEFFMQAGILPDLVVGDFDSLSEEGKKYLRDNSSLKVKRLKPEKDDSDTQSAVTCAVAEGAKNILLLGATGSRLDHLMANIELLALGKELGVQVSIMDANNYIRLVPSGTVLKKKGQFGRFVSFFPLGGEVQGLTLEGFKYPLKEHCLRARDSGLTVSNEIKEDTAEVTFDSGTLLMIMSRD